MGYQQNKLEFDAMIEKFSRMPEKERQVEERKWSLKLQFEIYGELSSLSHSYREMFKLVQKSKEEKK